MTFFIAQDKILGRLFLEKYGKPDWYFGDSIHDIATAKAMNCKIACITTKMPRDKLMSKGVDLIFDNYLDRKLYKIF